MSLNASSHWTNSILNLNSKLPNSNVRGFFSHLKCIKSMENWYKCRLLDIRTVSNSPLHRMAVVFTLFSVAMTNQYNERRESEKKHEKNKFQRRKSIKYREKTMECSWSEIRLLVFLRGNVYKWTASMWNAKSIKKNGNEIGSELKMRTKTTRTKHA